VWTLLKHVENVCQYFAPEIAEEETKTRVHIDHSRMDATLPIKLCCKTPAKQIKEGRQSASSNFQLQVPHHTSRRLAEDNGETRRRR
jgi:hypothetical protein